MKRIIAIIKNLFQNSSEKGIANKENSHMWGINKINEHIRNGVEENLHLDYKAADSLGKSDGKKKLVKM